MKCKQRQVGSIIWLFRVLRGWGVFCVISSLVTWIHTLSFMIDSWNHVARETYPNWLNRDGTSFSYSRQWHSRIAKVSKSWRGARPPPKRWVSGVIFCKMILLNHKGRRVSFIRRSKYHLPRYQISWGLLSIVKHQTFSMVFNGFFLLSTGLWPLGNFGCLRWWRFGSWNRLQASDWGRGLGWW